MPRKRKRERTPQEKEAFFEEWKATEESEYALLCELREKALEYRVDNPNHYRLISDLTFKIEDFMNEFRRIGKVFKVKGCRKMKKPIQQIHMRTAFFGGEKSREEPFDLDGLHFRFETKDPNQTSRDVTRSFIEILKMCLDVDNPDIFNPMRIEENRKDIIDAYKTFFKNYKKHIKKNSGHFKILDILK